MMMKDLMNQQAQVPGVVMEENMSNLTSASGEASVSSSNRNDNNNNNNNNIYPHHQYNFAPPNQQTQPAQQIKKKRNQPGNPGLNSKLFEVLLLYAFFWVMKSFQLFLFPFLGPIMW